MTDFERALSMGVIEDGIDLKMAKDYRTMLASDFFAKYGEQLLIKVGHLWVNDSCYFDEKFLERIDSGIETLRVVG